MTGQIVSGKNLVPDLVAGLTTGIANISDAMASAVLAGAKTVYRLYAINEDIFLATEVIGEATSLS